MSNNPFEDLASYLEAITNENKRYVGALASLAGDAAWFDFHAQVMQSLLEAKELARASDADAPPSIFLTKFIKRSCNAATAGTTPESPSKNSRSL